MEIPENWTFEDFRSDCIKHSDTIFIRAQVQRAEGLKWESISLKEAGPELAEHHIAGWWERNFYPVRIVR